MFGNKKPEISEFDRMKMNAVDEARAGRLHQEVEMMLTEPEIKKIVISQDIDTPYVEYISIGAAVGLSVYSLILNIQFTVIVNIPLGASIGLILSDVVKLVFLYHINLEKMSTTPKYQFFVVIICMGISIMSFTRVLSVTNESKDNAREQYNMQLKDYNFRLTSLTESRDHAKSLLPSRSSIMISEKKMKDSRDDLDSFLSKKTWLRGKRVSYSYMLERSGGICKDIKTKFQKLKCPSYLQLLNKKNSYNNDFIRASNNQEYSSAQKQLESFLSANSSLKNVNFNDFSQSSKLPLWSILILGFMAEFAGFLFVTRRITSKDTINSYRIKKISLRNYLIQITNTKMNGFKSGGILKDLNNEISKLDIKGKNLNAKHFEKIMKNPLISSSISSIPKLKEYMKENNLIKLRSSSGYSYKLI